jgi:hypothetical protein
MVVAMVLVPQLVLQTETVEMVVVAVVEVTEITLVLEHRVVAVAPEA